MPTAEDLKTKFPNASEAFLRLNSTAPAAIPPDSPGRKPTRAKAPVLPKAPKSQGMAVSGAVAMDGQGRWALTLPYPPSANRYWRTIVHTDKETKVSRALVFVSTEAKKYKEGITQLAGAFRMLTGPLGMRVRIYRPQRSGDLGNRIKVLEDALQGVAFENDSQIEYEELFRHDDKDNPRVEVEVWCLPTERQGEMQLATS
jgi:Holliday junction resolvase RusA-like endonuclease